MLLWDVLRVLVANKFLPLLLYSSPSPEGRDLMETFLLGLGVWSFLTHCNVWLQVSICSYLLQEGACSLMVAEQGMNLCI